MSYEIEAWIAVRRLTPGRRAFAAQRIGVVAAKAGYSDVASQCARVAEREDAHIKLERQYRVGKAAATGALWSPELLEEDLVQDRLIGELRGLLAAVSIRRSSPRGAAAKALLDAFFPEGVTYYTHQPMVEQAVRVGGLIGDMNARREEVDTATVGDVLDDLITSHARYKALLDAAESAEHVAYEAVKASDLSNQRAFLEIIVACLAATQALPDDQRPQQREALLSAADEQNRIVGELIRRKRRVSDVDPITGEPEPDVIDA